MKYLRKRWNNLTFCFSESRTPLPGEAMFSPSGIGGFSDDGIKLRFTVCGVGRASQAETSSIRSTRASGEFPLMPIQQVPVPTGCRVFESHKTAP